MRFPAIVVSFVACLGASGCTSGPAIEDLIPRPSAEITSSIAKAGTPARSGYPGDATAAQAAAASVPELVALLPSNPGGRASQAIDKIHPQRFGDAHPIDFGKIAPQDHAVHGVDVSRWQGDIDWPKLRSQGANFAYIKATDGADHLDPMFMKNWKGAQQAGIRRGAYHFFYWCSYASAQADWFIRNVPKVAGALPPVLDVEWNHQSDCRQRLSREKVLEKMQVFLDRLEQHYGQRPVIYTSPDFYATNLKNAFPDYPFWLRSVAEHPSKVYPGRDWLFWQYSGSGLSKGVEGRIDLNVFHGGAAEWGKWVAQAAG